MYPVAYLELECPTRESMQTICETTETVGPPLRTTISPRLMLRVRRRTFIVFVLQPIIVFSRGLLRWVGNWRNGWRLRYIFIHRGWRISTNALPRRHVGLTVPTGEGQGSWCGAQVGSPARAPETRRVRVCPLQRPPSHQFPTWHPRTYVLSTPFSHDVQPTRCPSDNVSRPSTKNVDISHSQATPSFVLGNTHRSYKHQYANIYFVRLRLLRPFAEQRAKERWGNMKGQYPLRQRLHRAHESGHRATGFSPPSTRRG